MHETCNASKEACDGQEDGGEISGASSSHFFLSSPPTRQGNLELYLGTSQVHNHVLRERLHAAVVGRDGQVHDGVA